MMQFRFRLALLALSLAAMHSEARPPRWGYQPSYSYPSYSYPSSSPAYQYPTYQYPSYPSAVVPASGYSTGPAQSVTTAGAYTSGYTPAMPTSAAPGGFAPAMSSFGPGDALDEVNAKRAARGLRPYMRDPALTQAAQACAAFRAQHGLFGHSSNDFGFLPPGTTAASAGCAAYPASYGWMSCCTYDHYAYAGAAYVTGRDGRRYMHLFVR